LIVCGVSLVHLSPARAAFPGENGRIVYSRFANGNYDLFTIRADGSGRKRVTKTTKFEIDPMFSPDGRWIAFARTDGKDLELFKVDVTGDGDPIQLTKNRKNDFDPTWSPSGTKLAFVRQAVSEGITPPADLFKVSAGGGDAQRIDRTDVHETAPSWSPDGRRIAFCAGPSFGDLAIHSITPSGRRRKALTGDGSYNCSPNWSPGGGRIAFYTDRDGDGELFKMERDGDRERRITDNTYEDQSPVWSPNGNQIVYARFRKDFALRKIRPDGSDDRRVVDGEADEQFPDWGPS
jgi:Tol biopolymer transport system component